MNYVFTIGVPLFVIFIQICLKFACDADFTSNLGVTIGAIGLGQIFPYLALENIIKNKLLKTKFEQEVANNSYNIYFSFEEAQNEVDLKKIQTFTLAIMLSCICLFMIVIVLSVKDYPALISIPMGTLNCLITWMFILYK